MNLAERQALAAFERRLFGAETRVQVGRYELLDKIGAGGAGLVYAALDPKLQRKVAIKFVHRGSEAEASVRLVREARALARLTHPNIVRVHDVGTVDDPGHEGETVYVVMELLEGESLRHWLERGPSWRAIVEIFIAAGRGLTAAHERGWVHRDFKPANIHVGTDGVARVLDFGFARSSRRVSLSGIDSRDELDPVSRLTAEGAVVGTLRYMAPEQRAGQREIDARADQYSFCLSLTEALGGVASPEGLSRLFPRIPRAIVRALQRGLSEDPEARWPSMDPLLAELAGAPRRRAWALAGGVVGLAGLVLTLAASRPTFSSDADANQASTTCASPSPRFAKVWTEATRASLGDALRDAGLPYAQASAASTLSTLDAYARRGDELSAQLCEAGEDDSACLRRAHDSLVVTLEVLASPGSGRVEAAVELARDLPELDACAPTEAAGRRPEHGLDAADDRTLTRLHAWRVVGELDRAAELGASLLAKLRPEQLQLRARASFEYGLTLLELGRFDLAKRALEDAYFDALERSDDHLALAAAIALIHASARAGEDTTRWRREGQAWLSRAKLDGRERVILQTELGRAQLEAGAIEAAREQLLAALAELDGLAQPPPRAQAELVMGLIRAQLEGAQTVAELPARARRILAAREATLGAGHPATLRTALALGLLLAQRGDPRAPELLEDAVGRSEAVLDADDLLLARARAQLEPAAAELSVREPGATP